MTMLLTTNQMPIGGLVLIILVVLAIIVGNIVYNVGKQRNKQKLKTKSKYDFVSNLFQREISVREEDVSEEYVKKCIDFFQNMNEKTVNSLVKQANDYYQEISAILDLSKLKMPQNPEGREILQWIYPKIMWIGNDEGQPEKMEFVVECGCEWESDHGLEIDVYDGKILFVGSYDGGIEDRKEEYLRKM